MPHVSVIVPCFNVAPYIAQCLDSLIAQTFRDWEAICVDDGSTDGTGDVLRRYADLEPRITVISQPNAGISAARNVGLDHATGEYVVFVDGDDWLSEDVIERALSTGFDLVLFSYNRIFSSGEVPRVLGLEGVHPAEFVRRKMVGLIGDELRDPTQANSLITVHSKLIRRTLMESPPLRFEDISVVGSEDTLFSVALIGRPGVGEVFIIDEPLYQYRRNNAASHTTGFRPGLVDRFGNLNTRLRDLVGGKSREFDDALSSRVALSLIGLVLNEATNPAGVLPRVRNVRRILVDPEMSRALRRLPLGPLPLPWKAFFILARLRLATGVWLLGEVIRRLMQRRNREA